MRKRYKYFTTHQDDIDLTLSLTDKKGRRVKQFLHFKRVASSFGFLFLERTEKDGIEIPKRIFNLQENSLISKWSQINVIISVINSYEPSNEDNLKQALKYLESMADLQLVHVQLQLLLTPSKGRRFTEHSRNILHISISLPYDEGLWCNMSSK